MEIQILKADITKLNVDAVVNAANTSLFGGGGVDGAIHRAGGPEVLEECVRIRNKQGGCKVGEAVITKAGKMIAKNIIHTVGPHWNGGKSKEEAKLENCYLNSLKLAEENGLESIAFPNISTGIYKFPKELAAEIALRTIENYKFNSVKSVVFCCFDEANFEIYKNR